MKFPSFFGRREVSAPAAIDPVATEWPDALGPASQFLETPPPGTIGALLVEAQRLSPTDAKLISIGQQSTGLPFGETGLRMGIIRQEDIDFALSRQFSLPRLAHDSDAIDVEVITARHPDHTLAEHLRNLRGHLSVAGLDRKPALKSFAVISTDSGAGRSFIAANLATVFAQLGSSTLLIDADLRAPRQHKLFRLANREGLSSILAGRSQLSAVKQIECIPKLCVLPSGPTPPNPEDLTARRTLDQLLRKLEESFRVIIIDTPAWNTCRSARQIAAAAGAAVQLVQLDHTAANEAAEMARQVTGTGCRIVGAVVNEPTQQGRAPSAARPAA